jgi:hypothetical protein
MPIAGVLRTPPRMRWRSHRAADDRRLDHPLRGGYVDNMCSFAYVSAYDAHIFTR